MHSYPQILRCFVSIASSPYELQIISVHQIGTQFSWSELTGNTLGTREMSRTEDAVMHLLQANMQ